MCLGAEDDEERVTRKVQMLLRHFFFPFPHHRSRSPLSLSRRIGQTSILPGYFYTALPVWLYTHVSTHMVISARGVLRFI